MKPPRGLAMIVDRANLVLEKILDLQMTRLGSNMRWEFLIRWKDALEEDSWETEDSLWRWKKMIAKYVKKLRRIARLPRTIMTLGGGECNAHESLVWIGESSAPTRCV